MEKFKTWNEECEVCHSKPIFKSSVFKILKSATFDFEMGKSPNFGNAQGGYDLAFSDVNQYHTKGMIYFYKMSEFNTVHNFCSLKCAFEFSVRQNSLVLYPDPDKQDKIRGISPDIIKINQGLGNPEELKYKGQPCGNM